MNKRMGILGIILLPLAGALLVVAGAGSRGFCQEATNPGWQVLIAYEKGTTAEASNILLRPNVTQAVFFQLKNTADKALKPVEVKLTWNASDSKEQSIIGQADMKKEMKTVEGQKSVPLKFPASPAPAKGPPPPLAEGPPYQFKVQVKVGKDWVDVPPLPVRIQQPHEYIQIDPLDPPKIDKNNKLTVRVKFKDDSETAGQPCKVSLEVLPEGVLSPEVIRGLKPPGGSFLAKLDAKKPQATLAADYPANFGFPRGIPPKNGRIYLAVDDYERAFMFHNTYSDGKLLNLKNKTRLRIDAPRYFPPAPDKPGAKEDPNNPPKLEITIEADGIEDGTKKIEVAFDRTGEEDYKNSIVLPSLREQSLSLLAVLPDGSLQFKTTARDWKIPLDAMGVTGKRKVRVRALGADDKEIVLADEKNQKDEAIALFHNPSQNRKAPLSNDDVEKPKAIFAEIILGASKPEGVQFTKPFPQPVLGSLLPLQAKAKQPEELQAEHVQVKFFVGDSPKDPGIEGIYDQQKKVWQGSVLVPPDTKEKVDVKVIFMRGPDLWSEAKASIPLLNKSGEPNLEKSTITGKVTWNGEKQKGRTVILKDGKGKQVGETVADGEGVYVFKDVAVGKYQVSVNVAGMLKGSTPAAVTKETGENVKAPEIKLQRIN